MVKENKGPDGDPFRVTPLNSSTAPALMFDCFVVNGYVISRPAKGFTLRQQPRLRGVETEHAIVCDASSLPAECGIVCPAYRKPLEHTQCP